MDIVRSDIKIFENNEVVCSAPSNVAYKFLHNLTLAEREMIINRLILTRDMFNTGKCFYCFYDKDTYINIDYLVKVGTKPIKQRIVTIDKKVNTVIFEPEQDLT